MAEALCPACADELGLDAWCAGHVEQGATVLRRLGDLPDGWDVATRLWWVATGEVRLDRLVVRRSARLAPDVRAALPRSDGEPEPTEPDA